MSPEKRPSVSAERIDYLEWISGRPASAEYDFASSDLSTEDGVRTRLDRLSELPRPESETTLEELIASQYDESVSAENVAVTAGTTTANAFTAATMIATWADERGTDAPVVVTESPGYEPLSATPRALGAEVRHFGRDTSDDYDVVPASVTSAVDDDTCLVSLTNRHNPSGRFLARETLESVAAELVGTETTLLVDEVYAPFQRRARNRPGTAFGGETAAGMASTVVTNSLTKFLGLNDLRIGWAIASPEFVEKVTAARWHAIDVSPTSRELARIALHNVDHFERRSRERLRANADSLASFVDGRDDLSGLVDADHTMAFLRHESSDGDDVVGAASDRGVLLVPGRFFGDETRFRISLGGDPDRMREGLDELGRALDDLS